MKNAHLCLIFFCIFTVRGFAAQKLDQESLQKKSGMVCDSIAASELLYG